MINYKQFKTFIVVPSLKAIDLYSEEATNLLLEICAQESKGLTYINQMGMDTTEVGGIGPYQMQKNCHNDIWSNYLEPHCKGDKANKVAKITNKMIDFCKIPHDPDADIMQYNLRYATCMCRIFWLRIPESIAMNLEGRSQQWKRFYNTVRGAGTEQEYISSYYAFIGAKGSVTPLGGNGG